MIFGNSPRVGFEKPSLAPHLKATRWQNNLRVRLAPPNIPGVPAAADPATYAIAPVVQAPPAVPSTLPSKISGFGIAPMRMPNIVTAGGIAQAARVMAQRQGVPGNFRTSAQLPGSSVPTVPTSPRTPMSGFGAASPYATMRSGMFPSLRVVNIRSDIEQTANIVRGLEPVVG